MNKKVKFEQMEHYGFGPNVMQKTRICQYCSTLVTDGASVCPVCRNKLPGATLFAWYKKQHKVCGYCKTVLADDSEYCPQCGRPVKKASAAEKE